MNMVDFKLNVPETYINLSPHAHVWDHKTFIEVSGKKVHIHSSVISPK